ncbi:acyl-CoA dehydrogenase family protein, partial [Streptomyces violaceoruber]
MSEQALRYSYPGGGAVRRTVFNEDHEAFRETLRAFIEAEVVPVYDDWFAAGQAPRE